MMLKLFRPHEKLQGLIKRYWLLEVNESGNNEPVQSFFPLDAIEIIFHFETPFLRLQNNQWVSEQVTFIEGQQSGTINVRQQGSMRTIGVSLYPWASIFFYNSQPVVFTNNYFRADEIDPGLRTLYVSLANTSDDLFIPDLCDNYFLDKLRYCRDTLTTADLMLIDLMHGTGSPGNVKEIRAKWSFSSRYFEKKCVDLLGVPAGELLKKRRMKKALEICISKNFISFTDVAHATGYYDQAHFIKDFKHYFNHTPREVFKNDNVFLTKFL
jgi:AraC-like DNA-binding protein